MHLFVLVLIFDTFVYVFTTAPIHIYTTCEFAFKRHVRTDFSCIEAKGILYSMHVVFFFFFIDACVL